jgi:UDP-2-acetamido-3-amino-2,3-dideoxy-glucuronate N-acetyltransferase
MTCKNWSLIKFFRTSDNRGNLVAIDFEKQLPFIPKRFFVTFDVPSETVRGEHAHLECAQVLLPIAGRIHVLLNDGFQSQEYTLDDPSVGLYIPKLIWSTQKSLGSSSVLGVFASHAYEESDYIRNFEKFVEFVRQT